MSEKNWNQLPFQFMKPIANSLNAWSIQDHLKSTVGASNKFHTLELHAVLVSLKYNLLAVLHLYI